MLREAVTEAARRIEVREAVAGIYAQLQREIDVRRPRCDASGRCCRFESFGHRLYVTTMELAAFTAGMAPAGRPPVSAGTGWDGSGCPFQVEGLCSVRSIRPFGCRIFFCDATSDQWQQVQYERFHARLKQLHDELGVPYRYIEWRAALTELGLASPSPAKSRGTRLSLPQLPL